MDRIYHPWDKWECYAAGFFKTSPPEGLSKEDCYNVYNDFFGDLNNFESGIAVVFSKWKNSCEHNLSNDTMNKVAWLGQASVCAMTGVSSNFRQGYNTLTQKQQLAANHMAEEYIKEWEFNHKQIKLDI